MQITQSQFIRKMNEETREKFNDSLFNRTDEDTASEIEKVVRPCERSNKYYSIKVHDFYVIKDYNSIQERLKNHEISRVKSKSNRQKIKSDIEERYSSGLIPFIIAHSIRENNRHVDLAPSSEPQNKKFFLDKTYGRIERSAIELSK